MSSGFDLLVDDIDGRLHAAVTRKTGLFDLYVDARDAAGSFGSLYIGKVIKLDKKLEAAIVDLGDGLQGMLPAKGASATGQLLAVTIKSEGRKNAESDAHKLPRLMLSDTAAEGAPRLLKAGPTALERALADYGADAFDHIHIAGKPLFNQMTDWCAVNAPALATSKRLRLFKPEKSGDRLFDADDIFSTLESLGDDTVALPEGGDIVFETTRAAVMVDVNQASAAGIGAVNRAAAVEMLRQLRLRNLSGVVLVDFINMPAKADRQELLALLDTEAAQDKAGTQVHGFTRLGFIEITRRRRDGWRAEKLRG